MKIAQVTPRYSPYIGGVETHVQEISERLVLRGIEVDVLTTDPEGKLPKTEIINGVNVKRFRSWAPSDSYYFSFELPEYIKKYASEYNLIHSHSYHALPSLYAAMNRASTPLIFTPHYHGKGHTWFRDLLHLPYKLIGGGIFNEAIQIIAVSEWEKKLLLESFNIDEKVVEVIPNGVNKREFLGLKRSICKSRNILSVGRLEQYKGMQYLLKVLPSLDEDVRLTVIGKGVFRVQLEKMIRDLAIGGRVNLIDYLDRKSLVQMYSDADLFVLLSEDEAYGITVAEALTAGTPCIVADASALTEWIDGKTCLGVGLPVNLITLKAEIEAMMGVRVQRSSILDWEDITDKLLSIYHKQVT